MDLRSGRVHESKEAALAAGVPESDLMEVERTADGRYRLPPDEVVRVLGGSAQVPHQGKRELARRARRMVGIGR